MSKEEKSVRRNTAPVSVFTFRHDDFPNTVFFACCRYVHVITEGPPTSFFDRDANDDAEEGEAAGVVLEVDEGRVSGVESERNFERTRNSNLTLDDMAELARQGIEVDNDNEPAPENVPDAAPTTAEPEALEWKEDGIVCPRRAANLQNSAAKLKNYSQEDVIKMSKLDLFLVLFPLEYLKTVVIPETNKQLTSPIDLCELLRFIGCWFYMSCWEGIQSRHDWWSSTDTDMFSGAPFRLNQYIARNRFNEILGALRYTNVTVDYQDGFFEMRQLEKEWNANMDEEFDTSWINVLDESMMEWYNKYAPGFMCVGRKPHPFGNERHTICCGLTTILWRSQIVEGKDRPRQLPRREFEELGKTVGLMLRMCQPLFGSGKAVVMDSGFCVAKGIVELEARGVYGAALIKKRRYWPKSVPGNEIDKHFEDKEVGYCSMLQTKTEEGKPFKIFCMKEPDYVMKVMASWMTLNELEGARTKRDWKENGVNKSKTFNYRQPFGLHFRYRHQVDDHNNRRHAPISIERTWATKFWADRNFAWYLAVSMVNANLAHGHFQNNGEVVPTLQFRRQLAQELLDNTIGREDMDHDEDGRPIRSCRMTRARVPCLLVTLKHYQGTYNAHKKKFHKVKQKYQKQRCLNYSVCYKTVRTYCNCTKGLFLCVGCFGNHKVMMEMKH